MTRTRVHLALPLAILSGAALALPACTVGERSAPASVQSAGGGEGGPAHEAAPRAHMVTHVSRLVDAPDERMLALSAPATGGEAHTASVESEARGRDGFIAGDEVNQTGAVRTIEKAKAGPSGSAAAPEVKKLEPGGVSAARRLATSTDLRPRAPALLARPNGPDSVELPLEAMRVSAALAATRARILVDCTFSNPHARQLQGTLMVRLPDGASPCYLGTFQGNATLGKSAAELAMLLPPPLEDPSMLIGASPAPPSRWTRDALLVDWGELRPARVVEDAQAKVIYEKVTRRRVDPALMEWSGGSSFSTRIFPIPASGRKRVVFAYDVPLLAISGRAAVALPVPLDLPPAFRLDVAADARSYEKAALTTSDGEVKLAAPAADAKGGDFARASWSPEKGAGNGASAGAEAGRSSGGTPRNEVEWGSFLLGATPRTPAVQAGFAEVDPIPGAVVHVRVHPQIAWRAEKETGEAVFVLDTSLSQRAKLGASMGRLLRAILERDPSIRRFEVVTFDVAARRLGGSRENTKEERERVLAEVDGLWLEGATNIGAALSLLESEEVERGAAPSKLGRTYFLLSDAQLTWGITERRELERAYPRVMAGRWIGYQIGDVAVNRPLLDRLARGGGRVVSVPDAQSLEAAAVAHRSLPEVLTGVRIEGIASSDVVVAGSPRSLFPEQVLDVAFRSAKGADVRAASIAVETASGTQRFPLAQAVQGDAMAARAWAELNAGTLLELEDEAGDRAALALSQRFAIANRVASFLILETDAEYKVHEIKTEELDIAAIEKAAAAREGRRPIGAPDISALDAAALAFLDKASGAKCAPWPRAAVPPTKDQVLARPKWPERPDPVAVYRDSAMRFERGRPDEALRVLSSIVEENPRDARALRLAGFALMGWGRYEDAAALFARTRALRPFEAQAYLCEALALEALGRAGDAALRYEIVLAGKFDPRTEVFAKAAAARLYTRLLRGLGAPLAARADAVAERAGKLGNGYGDTSEQAHELMLFWSIDDCDVDLHVEEPHGAHVYYSAPRSPTGGLLHWDNTAGLGPEIYTHPKDAPAEAYVHYFGTGSVEGTVPAATLLLSWSTSGGSTSVAARAAVLCDRQDKVVLYRATP